MGWHIRNDREREKERASEGEKQMESVVYRLWMNQGAEWGLIAGPSPLQTGRPDSPARVAGSVWSSPDYRCSVHKRACSSLRHRSFL